MNANSVIPHQVMSYYTNHTHMPSDKVQKAAFLVEATKGEVTQKDTSTLYKTLTDQYDVRNATFEEIAEISKILYKAGEISFQEHAVLSFDYGRATDYMKRYAPGKISADFDMYITPANSLGQRDWLAELSARAAQAFQFGELVGYQHNTSILTVLERLSR